MSLIKIAHPDIHDLPRTALTAAINAGSTSLTVENGLLFSASQQMLMDGYGNASSEVVRIGVGSPTATAITLNSATSFAHALGTTLTYIPYNQIAIEFSTDLATLWATGSYATLADASAAATWTSLITIDIKPAQQATTYDDGSTAARSYRTRFYNSFTAVYSNYSDPVLPTGFEEFSVGNIINNAIELTNVQIGQEDGGEVSYDFLFQTINQCIRRVHSTFKRWSWNQEFDFVVSELTAGRQYYALPTNIDYRPTNRAVFNLRTKSQRDLKYIDKRELDRLMRDVRHSALGGTLTAASLTITLTDTSDFDDSGSFTVITGTTKDTISYTANNRSTNTLTLASTNGATTTHASGTDVWQNGSFSNDPLYFTVYEGNAYLWPVPDTGLAQRTLQADFYKKMVVVNSINDYILFPDPLLIIAYLCYRISIKKRDDKNTQRFLAEYTELLEQLKWNEVKGQKQKFGLRLNPTGTSRMGRYNTSWIGYANINGRYY